MAKTIKLKESNQTVTMKCPSVKNVRNTINREGDAMELTIELVAVVCNMTVSEVEELAFPDYMQLQEALQSFLGEQAKSAQLAARS